MFQQQRSYTPQRNEPPSRDKNTKSLPPNRSRHLATVLSPNINIKANISPKRPATQYNRSEIIPSEYKTYRQDSFHSPSPVKVTPEQRNQINTKIPFTGSFLKVDHIKQAHLNQENHEISTNEHSWRKYNVNRTSENESSATQSNKLPAYIKNTPKLIQKAVPHKEVGIIRVQRRGDLPSSQEPTHILDTSEPSFHAGYVKDPYYEQSTKQKEYPTSTLVNNDKEQSSLRENFQDIYRSPQKPINASYFNSPKRSSSPYRPANLRVTRKLYVEGFSQNSSARQENDNTALEIYELNQKGYQNLNQFSGLNRIRIYSTDNQDEGPEYQLYTLQEELNENDRYIEDEGVPSPTLFLSIDGSSSKKRNSPVIIKPTRAQSNSITNNPLVNDTSKSQPRPFTSHGTGMDFSQNRKVYGRQHATNIFEQKEKIADLKKKLTESLKVKNPSKKALEKMRSSKAFNKDGFTEGENELADASEEEFPDNASVDLDDEEEVEFEELASATRAGANKPMFLNSVYKGRPRTIFFQYPQCCEKTRDVSRAVNLRPEEEKAYDLKFKSSTVLCLLKVFQTAGFKRVEGNSWNALWANPKNDRVKEMNRYQKVNHFPGCWHLGRKDNLWRNLSRMKRQFSNEYNFVPNTYLLNSDFQRFTAAKDSSESKALWIMKPCASACGRGIKLISKKTKLKKKVNYLVSEYIANPHLINGLKYDLRLYVLVSCYDPLRIYLHQEGLVRFATKKYSKNSKTMKERFMHLTNWSVNKQSDAFVKNTNTNKDDEGSKWSFSALHKKYEEMGVDVSELWRRIKDLIIKTIISAEPCMLSSLNRTPEHRNNCYELYGFDVLVDANLKPWLMEVNVCPSLNSSSPLDKKIKTTVMCDTMNLLGYMGYDRKKYEEERRNKTPGMEIRKHQPKNVNEVAELNENNCINLLSSDDWNVLFETDEEWYRKGDFERIFPLKDNVDAYSKYFEVQRYSNTIVWRWLKSSENFLEKICPKLTHTSV